MKIAPHYIDWEIRDPLELLLGKLGNHSLAKTIGRLLLSICKLSTRLDDYSQYLLPAPQPWVWYCTDQELGLHLSTFLLCYSYLAVKHDDNYLVFFHPQFTYMPMRYLRSTKTLQPRNMLIMLAYTAYSDPVFKNDPNLHPSYLWRYFNLPDLVPLILFFKAHEISYLVGGTHTLSVRDIPVEEFVIELAKISQLSENYFHSLLAGLNKFIRLTVLEIYLASRLDRSNY